MRRTSLVSAVLRTAGAVLILFCLSQRALGLECLSCAPSDTYVACGADESKEVCAERCRATCGAGCIEKSFPYSIDFRASLGDRADALFPRLRCGVVVSFGANCMDVGPPENAFSYVLGRGGRLLGRDIDWHWGDRDGVATADEFGRLLMEEGYEEAKSCAPAEGLWMIAVFETPVTLSDGRRMPVLSHAAETNGPNGWWSSKLGDEAFLTHRLSEIEGGIHGNVVRCYSAKASCSDKGCTRPTRRKPPAETADSDLLDALARETLVELLLQNKSRDAVAGKKTPLEMPRASSPRLRDVAVAMHAVRARSPAEVRMASNELVIESHPAYQPLMQLDRRHVPALIQMISSGENRGVLLEGALIRLTGARVRELGRIRARRGNFFSPWEVWWFAHMDDPEWRDLK